MKFINNHQILLAAAFLPLWGHAQETKQENIQEVIVHANRLQIPFSKDNRNVEILSSEQIKQLPVKNLNEVLGLLNGVDLRQRGPFGAQADVSIDGGSFEQTLVLVNGAKVSDPQTAHHSLNLPIPLDAIERIEVLRGAAARIYGVNALTGAINIITKTVDKTSIQANVYTGSSFKNRDEEAKDGIYYHAGTQIGASWFNDKHQHQVYYNKEKSNGQRYNTASQNDKIFYQGNLAINNDNELEWLGSYMYNRFGANGFYAAPDDKESEEIVETMFASLSSKHQLSEQFYVSPRITNRYNEDDYRFIRQDLAIGRSQHYTNAFSAELNSRYQTTFGDFGLGLESRFDRISSSNIGSHNRNNHGAYAEFRTEQLKNMTVNVGAYVNYNTQYGWQVYPGIDLGYNINPQWKIVFNTGSSQRIPSYTDLYLNQSKNIGNPNLRSENAWQTEGAIKFQSSGFIAHAGYFFREINEFIDWVRPDAQTPYQPFNMGNNKVHGINTNFLYTFQANDIRYRVNLGYNYLDASLKQTSGFISKYHLENLKHQAKLLFMANNAIWNASIANRFHQRISDKSYFLTDLRLGYRFPSLSVYADAQNIFDVTYIETSAIPMPGRWYSLGIKYEWGS
ncbi:TonB-dependent receptor plug domain-containing protein [Sphingobacterium chuzhouense]|uniref:TonB-dependent receptor n=1 Tax=Sphingobacterium chuzhouense TaxID=1742264 RepID=A0ABR7XQJ0_9SPHI|nr:TonB-dependent receptor [Sphingobacterium chuzhouense]MBD1421441.1 TonB-dependent receptor [Sphingobacterium chuzhouense]